MTEVYEEGKRVDRFKPAPATRGFLVDVATVNASPTLLTDGIRIDPNANQVCVEVVIDGTDIDTEKDVKLWLLGRGKNVWHAPDEGIITDLQDRSGANIFYIIMDSWIYERAYLEITKNDGSGTVSATLVYR